MSASREKQIRKNMDFAPKTAREAQQQKEAQRTRLIYGAVGVALAVAVIASVIWNSNVISRGATAATVDGEKYSAAQVSFYYRNAYVSFVNGWSYFLSYFGLDTSQPLSDQTVSDTAAGFLDAETGISWQEYFMQEGLNQIASVQNGLKQANEAGFTFPDSVQEEFDEGMETLTKTARGAGVTVGRYLQNMFGSVMTEKVYRTELLRMLQFQAYSEAYEDGLTYTAEELEAAYAENPQDYDQVAYELVTFDGSPAEEESAETGTEDTEAAAEAGAENAEEAAEAGTENAEEAAEAGAENAEETAEAGAENAEESAEAGTENAEEAAEENAAESSENGTVEIEDAEVPQASPEAVMEETAEDTATENAEAAEEAATENAEAAEDTATEEMETTAAEAGTEDAEATEEAATENAEAAEEAVTEDAEAAEAAHVEEAAAGPELEAARANAEELLQAYSLVTSSGQDLSLQQLSTVYDNASYTQEDGDSYENVGYTSEELRDWLYDSARQDGDTTLVENGDFVYVAVFHSRFRDEQKTVDVRHILIQPEEGTIAEGEEGHDEEEAQLKEAARAEAERILKEWEDGEATEDSFAALAQEYSADNADDGGLYTHVKQGDMVDTFNDWIFDPARQPGDTGIVETTYGYHIMYFVGDGLPAWEAEVTETLKSEAFSDWSKSLYETAAITREDFGMKFVL